MEALIALFFLCAVWLTILTFKLREQKAKNKALEKNTKFYLKELKRLSDEQDDRQG